MVEVSEARNPDPDEVQCFNEAVALQDSMRLITVIEACPGVGWADVTALLTSEEQRWVARVWAKFKKEGAGSGNTNERDLDFFSDEGHEGREGYYEP